MTHDGVCFVLVWPPVKEACGVKRISFQGKTRLMEAPRAELFLPDYIVQRILRVIYRFKNSVDDIGNTLIHRPQQAVGFRTILVDSSSPINYDYIKALDN